MQQKSAFWNVLALKNVSSSMVKIVKIFLSDGLKMPSKWFISIERKVKWFHKWKWIEVYFNNMLLSIRNTTDVNSPEIACQPQLKAMWKKLLIKMHRWTYCKHQQDQHCHIFVHTNKKQWQKYIWICEWWLY